MERAVVSLMCISFALLLQIPLIFDFSVSRILVFESLGENLGVVWYGVDELVVVIGWMLTE